MCIRDRKKIRPAQASLVKGKLGGRERSEELSCDDVEKLLDEEEMT